MSNESLSRRSFIQVTGAAAAALPALAADKKAVAPAKASTKTMKNVPFEKHAVVRIGLIGVGARGTSLLRDLLQVPGCEIKAVCDVDPVALDRAKARCAKAGKPEPATYGPAEKAFEQLCKRDDLDLIYIATPWEWHTPMAVCAMKHGKHAGVEVPAGVTLEECWELVRVSEATRKHCMMLENCCYGDNEMMVLAMVQKGLFGTLTHGEAAYIHDLRGVVNAQNKEGKYVSEALWRRAWHTRADGNLYPTHGLGPVCWYMGIHKGDRLESIVSFSSLEAAMSEDQARRFKGRGEKYVCGDMNTSIIRTAKGRTIMLQHDVVTPRPYTRHNLIQGSEGAFADYPERLYIDAVARKSGKHEWIEGEEALKPYREQYQHELWQRVGELARKTGGHGGMDYIMSYRVVECLREGLVPDFDVYDAAAWSAPFPLSIASVKNGGIPQKFPDFTRGNWKA